MTRPEWNAGEIYFFGHGEDQDLIELEKLLEHNQRSLLSTAKEQVFRNNIAAVFTEYPTNPLMKACDVIRYLILFVVGCNNKLLHIRTITIIVVLG